MTKVRQSVRELLRVGELLPIANDNINGLLGKDLYQKVNIINASYGLYGGTNTTWYRIGKYNYYLPSAVIIYMFHGQSGSIKSKFEISINFSGEKSVIVYGTAKSVVGYVHTGDGKVEIYVKVSPGYCFTALVAGGNIDNTDRYTTTTEPVDIVYIP